MYLLTYPVPLVNKPSDTEIPGTVHVWGVASSAVDTGITEQQDVSLCAHPRILRVPVMYVESSRYAGTMGSKS